MEPSRAPYEFASACTLPTSVGDFEMRVYRAGARGGPDAVALVARLHHGRPAALESQQQQQQQERQEPRAHEGDAQLPEGAVLLRVQDSCLTGEVFGSVRCDCRQQLDASLARLQREAALQHALGRRRRRRSEDASRSRPFDTGRDAAELEVIASAAARDGAGALPEGSDSGQRVVGLVVYLMQEGRGIGLAAKVSAYALQPSGALVGGARDAGTGAGLDTVDANRALGLPDDQREYGAVADILRDLRLLGVADSISESDCRSVGGAFASSAASPTPELFLMTNNPRKAELLGACGVRIRGRVACLVPPASALAAAYLRTKAERMGHEIPASFFSIN